MNALAGSLRIIWQVALADFRERTRRYPFLVAALVCAWLVYAVYIDAAQVMLGATVGYFNSAWTAATLAIIANTSLSLIGFFLVKNAIERDEQTRTGQLLAATSLSDTSYLLGKWLSNFAYLSLLAGIFLLGVPLVQQHRGAQYPMQPLVMLGVFLPLVLPTMAFTGALAVLWESIPLLKRGLGNVIFVILWMTVLVQSGLSEQPTTDLLGYMAFIKSARVAEVAQGVVVGPRSFELSIGHMTFAHTAQFLWPGFHWTLGGILLRLEWVALAAVVCVCALYWFKRFDPDHLASTARRRANPFLSGWGRKPGTQGQSIESKWTSAALPQFFQDRYSPLRGYLQQFQFMEVLRAELRLMLRSVPVWIYIGMGIANFVPLVAPRSTNMNLLPLEWLVPVLLWSQMGTREQRNNTAALLFSTPHSFLRQLPAQWAAGVLVALLASCGMLLRSVRFGDPHLFAACLTGAIFIPSLAIACGVWSNTPRLFEALYVGLWYMAVNGAPFADFMGMTPHSQPAQFLLLGVFLFAAALARRWWDVERGPAQRVLARVGGHH